MTSTGVRVPTNPAGASRRHTPCRLTSAPVTRHRRMIVFAETNDDVFYSRHTLAFKVADRATQYLRQIQHLLIQLAEPTFVINHNTRLEKRTKLSRLRKACARRGRIQSVAWS